MIELYTGFVGSGKSYAATKLGCSIVDAPLSRRYVIANFPIKPKATIIDKLLKRKEKENKRWIYKDNDELTVDYLIKKSLEMGWNKKEGSCLIIFDEASIPFNARTFHKEDRLKWIKFLSQSRKFGYDVIFITQDRRMLDKQIRHLCEYESVFKKLNNYPILGILLNMFRISIFAQVRYWNGTNMMYTKGQLKLILYRKKIAKRYDTLRLFDEEGSAQAKA